MSLSSLIVQREIASIREIEEALARQVLYGGDFVTNLFEVSRIEESALMPVVAESFGLPVGPAGELPKIPEEAARLVAAEVASERQFAPLAVGASLVVAVAEPLSRDAEQELAFALALPIEQRIAPLFRIRQALARDYGVAIDKRTARLLTKVIHKGPRIASTFPPPMESKPNLPARPPSSFPGRRESERHTQGVPHALSSSPGREVPGTFVRLTEAPPSRPVRRRRGPLTLDVAKTELEASAERDVVFDILFEFARQFFDYTALFIVHGDIAEGRDAFGDGASRDKVARVGVPLDLPNLLATARDAKKNVRKKPERDGLDPVLMADLGRDGTTECLVFPVIVRKRVVALLLGDGGASGIDDGGVRELTALVIASSGAFERVIMRRKLKGASDAPEGGVAAAQKKAKSEPPPPTQVSAPPPGQQDDERPSVEELAAPIRDLLAEPISRVATTTREPMAELSLPGDVERSDRPPPPPPNLLAVRFPSGAPIPREEPDTRSSSMPPRLKTGSMKRAEAPPLEFGTPSMPSIVTENGNSERALLAQIQGTGSEPPRTTRDFPFQPDSSLHPWGADPSIIDEPVSSPKASSPPPMRAAPITDMSPMPLKIGPIDRPPEIDEVGVGIMPEPITTHARIAAGPQINLSTTLMSGQMQIPQLPEPVAKSAPISPLIVVTPDEDMEPISLDDLDATPIAPAAYDPDATPIASAVTSSSELVLALDRRKGAPPLPPPAEPKPMPMSEQQVSVPPRKPPSSRSDKERILPSVIVDVSSEYSTLVDRVLSGPDDDAERDLLRAGGYAMPAIMAKFPGPIMIERERLDGALPRVADCGPIIRLVASQRRTALPFVLSHVGESDPELRFWATYLLTELVYPESIEAAVMRTFDEDARVRKAARAATRALAEAHPQAVIDRLGEIVNDARKAGLRGKAIEALGEAREPLGIPVLLPFLEGELAEIVRTALVTVTRQDFGTDGRKWAAWWETNRARHRLEWLIDALMHDQRALRGAASEELRTITKEYFAYYDDLPKRERERAQARYRDWWENIGRVRFSRASTRGA